MSSSELKNDYLEQVQQKQRQLEVDLKVAKRAVSNRIVDEPQAAMPMAANAMGAPPSGSRMRRSLTRAEQPIPEGPAVDVRITGFWRWRTVLVPPNAYVVHTRTGMKEPLHLGLGVSFPYDPYRDSFLVVPGAMQTIIIDAHCICRELQGLMVQGYVQWIIADFATAHKKLDFSDTDDPMRVVNVQLREQAEAAIKDKVATMGIDEVLSDKQPIIQELTARLRQVAEGEGASGDGLGLRIVTVQIKEAIVSSARLWENLQKPFRAERERVARLAELAAASVIQGRELEHQKTQESAQLATEAELAILRASTEAEAFNREQSELARRQQREQEVARLVALEQQQTTLQAEKSRRELEEAQVEHQRKLAEARRQAHHQEILKEVELTIAEAGRRAEEAQAGARLATAKVEAEAAVARTRQLEALAAAKRASDAQIALDEALRLAANRQAEVELGHMEKRQQVRNDLSASHLQAKLITALPEIAEKMPKPAQLHAVSIGEGAQGTQALTSLVAQVMGLMKAFKAEEKKG